MLTSNLSKVKPAFRTKGNVTGNFGAPKRTKEAYNSNIGVTKAKVLNLTTQDEYLQRLITAYQSTPDTNLKKFIYDEIRKIKIQRGIWKGQ